MGMTFATLELTDGSTSIDLLRGGVYAKDYRPGIPQLKDGGIWQDSALATGRRLIDWRFGNVNDTLDMAISGPNQDDTIAKCGDLLRLLEKARDFTASSWQSDPIWLKRQAGCESNQTYALVFDYRVPQISNPFAAPFAAATELATLDGFDLGLEHSIWLSEPPGTGTCVQVSTGGVVEFNSFWSESGAVAPAGTIYAMLQSSTNRVFAGDLGQILYSDDYGDTWAVSTALPVDNIRCMLQTTTGRILAGETGGIWRSDNDGGAWAFSVEAFNTVWSLCQLSSGRILAGDDNTVGQIWYSDDDGSNWAVLTTAPYGTTNAIIQTTSGRIMAGELGRILASDDNGATWYTLVWSTDITGSITALIQLASGRILACSLTTGIMYSDDGGDTWVPISTLQVYAIIQLSSERILASTSGNIYYSDDDGVTWGISTTIVTSCRSLLQTNTDRALAGDNEHIYKSGPFTNTTMGATSSCADEQFVANKQNTAPLTHVYVASGGGLVFGVNLLPCVFPVTLFPPAAVLNDAIYFGNNGSDPFESLVFDIDNVVTYTVSYTARWEYSTAAGWSFLTATDGTAPGAALAPFMLAGVNSVHWIPPTDWVARTVNGVSALWVRCRITVMGGAMTPPTQQNRNFYTITWPCADIAAAQVGGDIPALAQVKLRNRSDQNGTDAPTLWDNRIVAGLRSYDRGPSFTAYLNVSNEQNPAGMTVTLGANTAYSAVASEMITGITGQLAIWSAALADTTFVDRVTFTLAPVIARDYYGTFHAFLRARVTAGTGGDIHARLQVRTGSGGVTLTSVDDWLKGTTDHEVLDFGRISIPASGLLSFDDLGDSTVLAVQFRNDSGAARTVRIHDLILIPVDECAVDAVDYANIAASIIGRQSTYTPHLLDVDSLTYQKVDLRTPVRTADANEYVTSIYVPGGGPAILQANAQQRLWVFAMNTSTTGTSYNWLSEPWVAHSVQIFANERWLALRGAR